MVLIVIMYEVIFLKYIQISPKILTFKIKIQDAIPYKKMG